MSSNFFLKCLTIEKMSNDWTGDVQLAVGWTVHVQLSNGWTVYIQQTLYLKAYVAKCHKILHTFPARNSFQNTLLLSANFCITKSCYWTVSNFSDPCPYPSPLKM